MKSRIPKRHFGPSDFATFLVRCCVTLDGILPALRTGLLVTGIGAAALRAGLVADFLFVTGLLLQFSIWFENWWLKRRCG